MPYFSSEAEADAENLDDDELLAAYLGLGKQAPESQPVEIPDWPPAPGTPTPVAVDTDTTAWFKANSVNWQREINLVLRAWVVAHSANAASPL